MNYKTVPCREFSKGTCRYATKCLNLHDESLVIVDDINVEHAFASDDVTSVNDDTYNLTVANVVLGEQGVDWQPSLRKCVRTSRVRIRRPPCSTSKLISSAPISTT